LKRAILLVHRYLGIALCLLVATWCLSGIVMMYVGFPNLSGAERIAALAPLNFARCCDFAAARVAAGNGQVHGFDVEIRADRPVLRLRGAGDERTIDLRSGAQLAAADATEALRIAAGFGRATGVGEEPRLLGRVDRDQWTISGGFARSAPFYKISLGDARGTQIYVSARDGTVVQRTTSNERFWNYAGAVTHWLYFTPLRGRVAVWTQSVIWLSLLAVFLSATGIYLGVAQLQWHRQPSRWSPYRGFNYWHHWSGLIFGLFGLAWLISGCLSMNPWGLLQSDYGAGEGATLARSNLNAAQAVDIVQALAASGVALSLPGEDKPRQFVTAPFAGSRYLLASGAHSRLRLDTTSLLPAPPTLAEVTRAAQALQAGSVPVSSELLTVGDDYYYADHANDVHPVFRIVFGDAQSSRYYFDAVSGALISKFDRAARGYRWLFNAVHRWDFSPGMRRRPYWDLVVVTLLAGVAAGSLTGVVLGFRRVTPG
jgi:hypothetical protein